MVVAVLLVATLFVSARRTSLADIFQSAFVVVAVAEDGFGATTGSPVKVRDVEVGSVSDVKLVNDPAFPGKPVRIRMEIQRSAARFLADHTVARIVRPPFGSGMPPFGTSSIDLLTAGVVPLVSASVIPAEGEESMVATFAKLGADVQAIREQFIATLHDLGGTLANMRVLTDGLVSGKGVMGRALADDGTSETLSQMLRTASDATSDLRRIAADMKIAAARAPALERGAEETALELTRVIGRVNQVMDTVPRIVASAERTLATTEELVRELKVASSFAPELARKADVSIEEASRLVDAAQKNFLLRSTMSDRPTLRTEAEVRPSLVITSSAGSLRDAGAP